jgi:hypothetical protein
MLGKGKILGLSLLLVLGSFGGSLWHLQFRAEEEAKTSLGAWEEEIARSLLVEKKTALLERALNQVKRMDYLVTDLKISVHDLPISALREKFVASGDQCAFSFEVPLSLYGLSAGSLGLCRSKVDLIFQTLFSGPFLGTLILGLLLISFFSRENWKVELQKSKIEARFFLQEELARASRQVAHDIRSPLSALQILAGLSHEMGEEKSRLLRAAVERIKKISDDLLVQGKMSLGGQTTFHDLRAALGRISSEMSPQFPEQIFETSFDVSEGRLPQRPEVWERILQNILRNAFEANTKGCGGKVICSVQCKAERLHLTIQDEGIGIPPAVLKRIGEEGFTFGKENGTGLGIFFVRSQLRLMDGELRIHSVEGQGTSMEIICPILPLQSRALSQETA